MYKLIKPLLFCLDPEFTHDLAILGLKYDIIKPLGDAKTYPRLETTVAGLKFPNPIGLAAGFDKDAECLEGIFQFGFGFVEVGTVTPKAQNGNPKPRLFRLKQDRSIINRFGFNNAGINPFVYNILHFKSTNPNKIVGANIGKNKTQANPIVDYIECLEKVYPCADYITINISSPNTPNLRNLEHKEQLRELLRSISLKRHEIMDNFGGIYKPIFVKISPDLSKDALCDVYDGIMENKMDGIIISNTTTARPDNLSPQARKIIQKYQLEGSFGGGLSGEMLKNLSLEKLRTFSEISLGKLPIISVGGISTTKDIIERLQAGACLIQIYSSFIYEGFGVVEKLKQELDITRC